MYWVNEMVCRKKSSERFIVILEFHIRERKGVICILEWRNLYGCEPLNLKFRAISWAKFCGDTANEINESFSKSWIRSFQSRVTNPVGR